MYISTKEAPSKKISELFPISQNNIVDSDPYQWLNELPFREFLVKGKPEKFYTIGALARALGKSQVTIRSWEQKGWLPAPSFRTPPPKGDQIPGKATKGLRLYTRDQLLFLVQAYDRYVESPHKPDWEAFRQAIKRLYPR